MYLRSHMTCKSLHRELPVCGSILASCFKRAGSLALSVPLCDYINRRVKSPLPLDQKLHSQLYIRHLQLQSSPKRRIQEIQ